MNHPRETYQAEVKPYQLAIAKAVGFRVAPTLIGNDASSFGEFAPIFVVKPLDAVYLRDGDDSLFAYTTTASLADLADRLQAAPVIAQELLSPKVDIRVTVVGRSARAVRILQNGEPIEGDWRKTPKAVLQYEDWPLPPDISAACLDLTSRLGLSFGGIDLIEDARGIFFVEINPTGEWAWINSGSRHFDCLIAEWLASGGTER
jgi:glutathione synthase/RimK-type ligase-like ATP-grasp enzyme